MLASGIKLKDIKQGLCRRSQTPGPLLVLCVPWPHLYVTYSL
jgi:hypothetical protein